ncbi:MAG: PadR family transcriptional regulator [Ignisphaera sp.]|nr:PadR family transcriptional regulator [Ignisphaera sp.]
MESRALARLRRKITVEVLWLYVAKVLARSNNPLRAYEIIKALREEMGLKVSTITAYRVIYRMSGEGLLEVIKVGGENLYKLSDRGREEFNKAVELLETIVKMLKT